MNCSNTNSHWIGRILGAVVLGTAGFTLLSYWNTWGLSEPIRLGISVTLGLLFLIFGGSIWRWIAEVDYWS